FFTCLPPLLSPLFPYTTLFRSRMELWLWIKLAFVLGLYIYFIWMHKIYKQQINGVFRYSSTQLRVFNEIATIFLVAIVFLVTVRSEEHTSELQSRENLVCRLLL